MSRYTDFLLSRYGTDAKTARERRKGDLAVAVQKAFQKTSNRKDTDGNTEAEAATTEYLMSLSERTPGGRPATFTTERDRAYCTCGLLKKQHGVIPGHLCTKQYPKE